MQSYNNSNQTGYHFTLEKFKDNKLVEKLNANRIEWDSVKQTWRLKDWSIKKDDVFLKAVRNIRNSLVFRPPV